MTALELSRNIRGKKICVSDSVESVFHQIRKKENKIHAYLDLYEEDAYKRAEQVQKGIEQGIYTGPLAGWNFRKSALSWSGRNAGYIVSKRIYSCSRFL